MVYGAICPRGAIGVLRAGYGRDTLSSSCADTKGAAVLIAEALRFGYARTRDVAAIAMGAVDVASAGSAAVAVATQFAGERPCEFV